MQDSPSRRLARFAKRLPGMRALLFRLYAVHQRRHPWMQPHPFDRQYGVRTNGVLPEYLLGAGRAVDAHTTAYAGCQPSCLRHALQAIPDPQDYTFVDLGCGKGRAVILASECQFRAAIGVELTPALAAIARQNVAKVAGAFPGRCAMEIMSGDATSFALPAGHLVFFLYHSFGPALVARMLERITRHVAGSGSRAFLIYENPVHASVVDGCAGFTRWACATIPCAPDEAACTPDDRETFVIWQAGMTWPAPPAAATPVVVTKAGWQARLASDLPH